MLQAPFVSVSNSFSSPVAPWAPRGAMTASVATALLLLFTACEEESVQDMASWGAPTAPISSGTSFTPTVGSSPLSATTVAGSPAVGGWARWHCTLR